MFTRYNPFLLPNHRPALRRVRPMALKCPACRGRPFTGVHINGLEVPSVAVRPRFFAPMMLTALQYLAPSILSRGSVRWLEAWRHHRLLSRGRESRGREPRRHPRRRSHATSRRATGRGREARVEARGPAVSGHGRWRPRRKARRWRGEDVSAWRRGRAVLLRRARRGSAVVGEAAGVVRREARRRAEAGRRREARRQVDGLRQAMVVAVHGRVRGRGGEELGR